MKFLLIFLFTLFTIFIFDAFIGRIGLVENSKIVGHTGTSRFINLREHSPNLKTNFRPDDEYMKNIDGLVQKKYPFRVDSDGFILPIDKSKSLISEKIKIIFLGGSTTENLYIEEDKRFPALVSDILTKKLNRSVVSLNAGVSGNHSVHSLFTMASKGLKYSPNYAIFMHAINDIGHLTKFSSYWNGSSSNSVIIDFSPDPSKKNLFNRAARFLKNLFIPNLWSLISPYYERIIQAKKTENSKNKSKKSANISNEEKASILKEFRSSLLSFVSLTRAWGVEPILLTQMNRLNIQEEKIRDSYSNPNLNFESFVSLYNEFNEITRKVALALDITLIDLDLKLSDNAELIYDSVHLTEKGNILVAEIIAERIYAQIISKRNKP